MYLFLCLVAAVAEETKQIKEQVDKVEIQAQSADSGELANRFHGCHLRHSLDLLGVPCGKADKYQHTCAGNNPVHSGAAKEYIDYRTNYQADKRHEEYRAPAGEIL